MCCRNQTRKNVSTGIGPTNGTIFKQFLFCIVVLRNDTASRFTERSGSVNDAAVTAVAQIQKI